MQLKKKSRLFVTRQHQKIRINYVHFWGVSIIMLNLFLSIRGITYPLNELLREVVQFQWRSDQQKAFEELKQKLASGPVLMHYNPHLALKLDTDASFYGIGAVISHILPNSDERPKAFSSRTLSKSERNYSQLEKESLSITFGIQKFHQYLYGRKFLLVTDHKPLLSLLGPKSGIPTLAAARMQRWALKLSAY